MKTKQLLSRAFTSKLYPVLFAVGLFTSFEASAQVKIGTNPAVIGAGSNLEVEASNNQKVIVDKTTGTLKVENKPLAASTDSIVTRDKFGELHQMSMSRLLNQQNVPVTVFSGILTSNYTIPVFIPHDLLAQRIPLTPRVGYSSGWNSTTKQFTLPSDGFYQVEAGLVCRGTGGAAGTNQYTRIWSSANSGGGLVRGTINITTTIADWQSLVWSGEWAGGSTISLDGATLAADVSVNPTTGTCFQGYLNVTKVR